MYRGFVPGKPSQPGLLSASKAGANLSVASYSGKTCQRHMFLRHITALSVRMKNCTMFNTVSNSIKLVTSVICICL
jgi:hypothetical protein